MLELFDTPVSTQQQKQAGGADHHTGAGTEGEGLAVEDRSDSQQHEGDQVVADERRDVQLEPGAVADQVSGLDCDERTPRAIEVQFTRCSCVAENP